MSNFTDFMTMKLIQHRRMVEGQSKDGFDETLFEHFNLTKNLNVRTKVDLISRIETLASFLGISKAQLVTEILESNMQEAMNMMEKEGWIDSFLTSHFKNLETQYGFIGKDHDEKGFPTKFDISQKNEK